MVLNSQGELKAKGFASILRVARYAKADEVRQSIGLPPVAVKLSQVPNVVDMQWLVFCLALAAGLAAMPITFKGEFSLLVPIGAIVGIKLALVGWRQFGIITHGIIPTFRRAKSQAAMLLLPSSRVLLPAKFSCQW